MSALLIIIYMKYKYSFFIIILLFLSCSGKKQHDFKDAEIKIDIAKKEAVEFNDLIADNYFVKLEATDKSNLRYISDVQVTSDKIFVSDIGSQTIFIYTFPEGNFIREINALGVGPNEYYRINDFQVDEKNRSIEVLDSNQKKIVSYDFEGKYLSTKKIGITGVMEFLTLDNGERVFSGILKEDYDNQKYQIIKSKGSYLKNKIIEHKKEYGFLSKSPHSLTRCNSSVYFNPIYSPLVFQLDGEKMIIKYLIDFGGHWMDNTIMYANKNPSSFDNAIDKNNFVKSLNVVVGTSYLAIKYYFEKEKHFCLYELETKKLYDIENFNEGILNGIEYEYFNNGYFISVKDPISLLEVLNKQSIDTLLMSKDFANGLNSNDNQVLMFTKFRKKL